MRGGFGNIGRADKIRTFKNRSLEDSIQGMDGILRMGQFREARFHSIGKIQNRLGSDKILLCLDADHFQEKAAPSASVVLPADRRKPIIVSEMSIFIIRTTFTRLVSRNLLTKGLWKSKFPQIAKGLVCI